MPTNTTQYIIKLRQLIRITSFRQGRFRFAYSKLSFPSKIPTLLITCLAVLGVTILGTTISGMANAAQVDTRSGQNFIKLPNGSLQTLAVDMTNIPTGSILNTAENSRLRLLTDNGYHITLGPRASIQVEGDNIKLISGSLKAEKLASSNANLTIDYSQFRANFYGNVTGAVLFNSENLSSACLIDGSVNITKNYNPVAELTDPDYCVIYDRNNADVAPIRLLTPEQRERLISETSILPAPNPVADVQQAFASNRTTDNIDARPNTRADTRSIDPPSPANVPASIASNPNDLLIPRNTAGVSTEVIYEDDTFGNSASENGQGTTNASTGTSTSTSTDTSWASWRDYSAQNENLDNDLENDLNRNNRVSMANDALNANNTIDTPASVNNNSSSNTSTTTKATPTITPAITTANKPTPPTPVKQPVKQSAEQPVLMGEVNPKAKTIIVGAPPEPEFKPKPKVEPKPATRPAPRPVPRSAPSSVAMNADNAAVISTKTPRLSPPPALVPTTPKPTQRPERQNRSNRTSNSANVPSTPVTAPNAPKPITKTSRELKPPQTQAINSNKAPSRRTATRNTEPANRVATQKNRQETRAGDLGWVVYVMSTTNRTQARDFALKLHSKGYRAILQPHIHNGVQRFRVAIHSHTTKAAAIRTRNKVRQQLGVKDAWVARGS